MASRLTRTPKRRCGKHRQMIHFPLQNHGSSLPPRYSQAYERAAMDTAA